MRTRIAVAVRYGGEFVLLGCVMIWVGLTDASFAAWFCISAGRYLSGIWRFRGY